jgi:hypothetical protein
MTIFEDQMSDQTYAELMQIYNTFNTSMRKVLKKEALERIVFKKGDKVKILQQKRRENDQWLQGVVQGANIQTNLNACTLNFSYTIEYLVKVEDHRTIIISPEYIQKDE